MFRRGFSYRAEFSGCLTHRAEHIFDISPTVGAFVPEHLALNVLNWSANNEYICFPVFERLFCSTCRSKFPDLPPKVERNLTGMPQTQTQCTSPSIKLIFVVKCVLSTKANAANVLFLDIFHLCEPYLCYPISHQNDCMIHILVNLIGKGKRGINKKHHLSLVHWMR